MKQFLKYRMKSSSLHLFALLICSFLMASVFCMDPPLWPETFTQDFVQGDDKTQIYTTGKIWYDIKNNRQRFDVKSNYFDLICQSVSLKINSSCSQVTKNDTLYIVLPDNNQCCKCCTKEQGCDIIPRDWLKDYEYVGVVPMLEWAYYNAWTQYDMPVNKTYYATTDENMIPKKMEYGSYGINFLVATYTQNSISDSVFALPANCEKNCPKTSFCQNFKKGSVKNEFQQFGFLKRYSKRNMKSVKEE